MTSIYSDKKTKPHVANVVIKQNRKQHGDRVWFLGFEAELFVSGYYFFIVSLVLQK